MHSAFCKQQNYIKNVWSHELYEILLFKNVAIKQFLVVNERMYGHMDCAFELSQVSAIKFAAARGFLGLLLLQLSLPGLTFLLTDFHLLVSPINEEGTLA
jgi:hypothetical protein